MSEQQAVNVGPKAAFRFVVQSARTEDDLDELSALAMYCAARHERQLGAIRAWDVRLTESSFGTRRFIARVRACVGALCIVVAGASPDPCIALWEAMCGIEQPLREVIARGPEVASVECPTFRKRSEMRTTPSDSGPTVIG